MLGQLPFKAVKIADIVLMRQSFGFKIVTANNKIYISFVRFFYMKDILLVTINYKEDSQNILSITLVSVVRRNTSFFCESS